MTTKNKISMPAPADIKVLVTTSAFLAGAVIDGKTRMVVQADPCLAHLRGCSEEYFRKHCADNKWAVAERE
jgi:hypothetical protein